MKLVSQDKDTLTITMSKKDFADLWCVVSAAVIDFDKFDREIIDMTKDQISDLEDALGDISAAKRTSSRDEQR